MLVGGDQQGWNGMVRASGLHTAGIIAAYPSHWGMLGAQGTALTRDWASSTRNLSIACSGWGRVTAEQTALQGKTPEWGGVHGRWTLLWFCSFQKQPYSQFGPGLVGVCETFTSSPKVKYRNSKYLRNFIAI